MFDPVIPGSYLSAHEAGGVCGIHSDRGLMTTLEPVDPGVETRSENSCVRRIYLMQDLPPEIVAVTFAKTSRSPEPFDRIAAELSESSSARFHEKWVVGLHYDQGL